MWQLQDLEENLNEELTCKLNFGPNATYSDLGSLQDI